MVKTRQYGGIKRIGFANSSVPGFGIEVIELADVLQRVGFSLLASPRRTTFYQLTLVTGGTLEHEIDFVRYKLKVGMLAFVRPDQVQRLTVNHRSKAHMLLIEPSFMVPDLLGLHLSAVAPVLRPVQSAYEAFLAVQREYFLCRDHPGHKVSESILQHQLLVLLFQMQRQSERLMPQRPSENSGVFQRFEEEVEKLFTSERSVSVYARRLGCSEKTLDRACASAVAITPKQLIQRRVILEAKRVLAHSDASVKSLAHDLGFSEVTNFVKYFRRATAESPAAFRKRIRTRIS